MYISAFSFLREQRLVKDREIPEYLLPLLFDFNNKKVLVEQVGIMTYKITRNPGIDSYQYVELINELIEFFKKYALVKNIEFYEDNSVVLFASDPIARGLEQLTPLMFLDLTKGIISAREIIEDYCDNEEIGIYAKNHRNNTSELIKINRSKLLKEFKKQSELTNFFSIVVNINEVYVREDMLYIEISSLKYIDYLQNIIKQTALIN